MSVVTQLCCIGIVILSLPFRVIDVLLLRSLRYGLNLLLVTITSAVSGVLLFPAVADRWLQFAAPLLGLAGGAADLHEILVERQLNPGALITAATLLVLVVRPIAAGLHVWEVRRHATFRPAADRQVPLSSLVDGRY